MEELLNFIKNKSNLINILILGILILGLPTASELVRQRQIISSQAAGEKIEVLEGKCVQTRNSKKVATCDDIGIKLVPPTQFLSATLTSADFIDKVSANDCSYEFQYPECSGNGPGMVQDVWQDCHGTYDIRNEHFQSGACGDDGSGGGGGSGGGPQSCSGYNQLCWDDQGNQGIQWCNGGRLEGNNCAWDPSLTTGCDACQIENDSGGGGGGQCPDWQFDSSTPEVCGQTVADGESGKVCRYEADTCTGNTRAKPGSCKSVPGLCGNCPDWQFKDQTTVCGQWVADGEENKVCNYEVDTCTGDTRAKSGSCNTVAGECGASGGTTGVPVGTGGCCSNNADCKASNTYQGKSTAGWTCTDTNPSCQGGKACKPPSVTQPPTSAPSQCNAATGRPNGCSCTNASNCSSNRCGSSGSSITPQSNLSSGGFLVPEVYAACGGCGLNGQACCDPADLCEPGRSGGKGSRCKNGLFCETGICQSEAPAANPTSGSGLVCLPATPTSPHTPTTVPSKGPIEYRIGEDPTDLANASYKTFPQGQQVLVTNHKLKDTTPGPKFLYVEYKQDNKVVNANPFPVQVDFVGADPAISGLTCNIDISQTDLLIGIVGTDLGANGQNGSVTANNASAQVVSWTPTTISARLLTPSTAPSVGQPYTVVVTRSDGQKAQATCQVGVSQLSLGAKPVCVPTGQGIAGVKVDIKEKGPGSSVAREVVSIDKNGAIQGLKTVLQGPSGVNPGKTYEISVDAPHYLRRNATATASAGTTIITGLSLPWGDICTEDGKINAVDKACLNQQWGKVKSAAKDCDCNGDGDCNSFEWSYQRSNFNATDDSQL